MNDVVFVSVAFGEKYVEQQRRLRTSILAIYPDANMIFWENEYPEGSKTMDLSLYGFKVHAVAEARKRYRRVIWVDTAMVLLDKVDDLLSQSMVAIRDDNKLYDLISDRACEYYYLPKWKIKEYEWHLVGGSLYYFDFNTSVAKNIFARWSAAEAHGIFGSQQESCSELINGHRHDESCMAMSMYYSDHEPTSGDVVRYCVENNPMFKKLHFK